MQACHQDKMRFNILDGKSSVVWPTSLLPGLESKCCEGKGDLPSGVTHLNAKDAFLHSSLSFFFCSHLNFANPLFIFTVSLHPLSSLLLICFLSLSFHLPSNCLSSFATSLLRLSRTAASRPLELGLHPPDVSLKVKITFVSFTWHFCLLQFTIHRDFKW